MPPFAAYSGLEGQKGIDPDRFSTDRTQGFAQWRLGAPLKYASRSFIRKLADYSYLRLIASRRGAFEVEAVFFATDEVVAPEKSMSHCQSFFAPAPRPLVRQRLASLASSPFRKLPSTALSAASSPLSSSIKDAKCKSATLLRSNATQRGVVEINSWAFTALVSFARSYQIHSPNPANWSWPRSGWGARRP